MDRKPADNLNNDIEMRENNNEDSNDSESNGAVPEMTLEMCAEMINQVICELKCRTNASSVLISLFVNMMMRIALSISQFLKGQVVSLLRSLNVDLSGSKVVEFLKVFDNIGCLFQNTGKHNFSNFGYVIPEEICFAKDKNEVQDSFQYISIKSTLMALYRNISFVKLIENETPSTPGLFKSYIDGNQFESKEFFQTYKHALRISLYFEEIEFCNLYEQSSVQKIGCFYYTIQNADIKLNSKSDNMFLLAICYSSAIKMYGLERILGKFIAEMEELESDKGVEIYAGHQSRILRATLVSFVGDTLPVHDVLGFSGPGSNKFCRECLITMGQFQKDPNLRAIERTAALHSEHLQELNDTDYNHSIEKKGVKADSILNRLRNFHCTENNVFDPKHDLLEGVVPFTIKCVLRYYIQNRRLFSVMDFNERLKNFRYGYLERSNRPSPNFTQAMLNSESKTLKQTSSQCWLLLRVFPFLVGHSLIDNDFEYLDLLVTLLKICTTALSTTVNDYLVVELDFLTKSYITQFRKLFADKKIRGKVVKGVAMINEQHHLLHYATNIMCKGPTALYSSMRFEGEHLPIKQHMIFAQNLKNGLLTVALRQSMQQSFSFKKKYLKKPMTLVTSAKFKKLERVLSREIIVEKFGSQPIVKVISSCIVRGVEYRPNFVFYIQDDENSTMHPSFVILKEMVEMHDEIYFLCHHLEILELSDIYNAYEVEETTDAVFLKESEIVDDNPVNIWKKRDSESKYLSIKYCY